MRARWTPGAKQESSKGDRELLTARKRRSLSNAGERIGARAGKSGFALDLQPFAKASQHELQRRGTWGEPGQEEARIEIVQTVGAGSDPAFSDGRQPRVIATHNLAEYSANRSRVGQRRIAMRLVAVSLSHRPGKVGADIHVERNGHELGIPKIVIFVFVNTLEPGAELFLIQTVVPISVFGNVFPGEPIT